MSRTPKLALISALLFLAVSCRKGNYFRDVRVWTNEPEATDITIKMFSAEGYKMANPAWNLESGIAFISYTTGKIRMRGLQIKYFGDDKLETILTGEAGELDRKSNDILIWGNVEVNSSNGRKLLTEKLYWDSKKEELSTDQPVKIIYPNGELIQGSGMRSDGSLNNIVIFDPAGVHPPQND